MASAPRRANAACVGFKSVKLKIPTNTPSDFMALEITAESLELPKSARQLAMCFSEAIDMDNAACVDVTVLPWTKPNTPCGRSPDSIRAYAKVAGSLDWVAKAIAMKCLHAHMKVVSPCTIRGVKRKAYGTNTEVMVNRVQADPKRVVFLVAIPPSIPSDRITELTFDVPDGMAIKFPEAHNNRRAFFRAWQQVNFDQELIILDINDFPKPPTHPRKPALLFVPCSACAPIVANSWSSPGMTNETKMCMLCGDCFNNFKAKLADKTPPAPFIAERVSPFVVAPQRTDCPLEGNISCLDITWEKQSCPRFYWD